MKTKVNDASVEKFIDGVANATRREDARAVLALMKSITRKPPKMWGPSIVGFDQYHYQYDSGREGDMCMIGFSPRAQALTLYLMRGFPEYDGLVKKLGKCSTSMACLYINTLADVDLTVLRELVAASYRHAKATHGGPGTQKVEDPRRKPASARTGTARRRRS
jgi:hypothetical protein